MTKILFVDDEYLKPGAISDFAISIDKNFSITHVTTTHEARMKIRETQFDLMFIDINLPAAMGATPNNLGGMELFDLMVLDKSSKIPYDIIFISEKEDSLDTYVKESEKRGVAFCHFEKIQAKWKTQLNGKLALSLIRSKKLATNNPTVDVAIITALGNPEFDAVMNLPYNWEPKRFIDDPTGYYFGKKNKSKTPIKIVAATARRKGMSSSSALAMKMVERFKPKIIVMLGICAGVKGKVNLGDVIVADPSWDWGSGKMFQDEQGSQIFQSAPHQVSLDHHISQLSMEIASDPLTLSSIISGWPKDMPQGKLKVHVGPMASGAVVLASDDAMQSITHQNRDLIGVDMEAYAVMAASDFARKMAPKSIVIKSVCDYADSEKNNTWQEFASYTSAAFFDRLISDDFFPI